MQMRSGRTVVITSIRLDHPNLNGPHSNSHLLAADATNIGKFTIFKNQQIGLFCRCTELGPCLWRPVINQIDVRFERRNRSTHRFNQIKQSSHRRSVCSEANQALLSASNFHVGSCHWQGVHCPTLTPNFLGLHASTEEHQPLISCGREATLPTRVKSSPNHRGMYPELALASCRDQQNLCQHRTRHAARGLA